MDTAALLDAAHEARAKEYVPNNIRDSSKLRIADGVIRYRLYDQAGGMTAMSVKDTLSNRLFVSWVQIHDRYGPRPKGSPSQPGGA